MICIIMSAHMIMALRNKLNIKNTNMRNISIKSIIIKNINAKVMIIRGINMIIVMTMKSMNHIQTINTSTKKRSTNIKRKSSTFIQAAAHTLMILKPNQMLINTIINMTIMMSIIMISITMKTSTVFSCTF